MAKAAGKGPGKGPPCKGLPKAKAPAKGAGKGRPATKPAAEETKLRPLFWQTVAQVPTESFWSSAPPAVDFDFSALEKRFAWSTKTIHARPAPGEARKKLRVLDDRTSQLLAISFNKLPPAERLTQVVDTMESFPEGMAPEALVALHTAFSDQKEAVEQLKQLDVPESELCMLDLPERYLWVLGHHAPLSAKIASGALIVKAAELPEFRGACERVRKACSMLKSSELVRNCISTALAVGNVLNRGTCRQQARAVQLPDGLLKLDELRSGDSSNLSLLDFVCEALMLEARSQGKEPAELMNQACSLHDALHAARGVCLVEAESACSSATRSAALSGQALGSCEAELQVMRLARQVRGIEKEAKETSEHVAAAKAEMAKQMEYFSAKPNVSSSDWLSSWVQFLDVLSQALRRVKLPPPEARRELKDVTNAEKKLPEKREAPAMQLDDDERIEVLLARMAQAAQAAPAAAPQPEKVEVRAMEKVRVTSRVPVLRK